MSQKLFYAPNDYVGLEDLSGDYDVSAKRIKTTPEVRQKAEAFIAKSKPTRYGQRTHICHTDRRCNGIPESQRPNRDEPANGESLSTVRWHQAFRADFTYPSPSLMDSSGCVGNTSVRYGLSRMTMCSFFFSRKSA
jgi:hypothetical protein